MQVESIPSGRCIEPSNQGRLRLLSRFGRGQSAWDAHWLSCRWSPEMREESAKPFRGLLDGWRHKLITALESQHTPAGTSRVGDPLERPPQRTDP